MESLLHAVMPKKAVDTDATLLNTLKSNNETLQNINLHFLDIYQRFEVDMVHEAVKTDLRTTKAFVVDQASAGPPLAGVRYYGIEATHAGMCKFASKNAPGYLNVSTTIKAWARECTPLVQSRWVTERKARQLAKKNEAMELLGIFNESVSMPHPWFRKCRYRLKPLLMLVQTSPAQDRQDSQISQQESLGNAPGTLAAGKQRAYPQYALEAPRDRGTPFYSTEVEEMVERDV